MCDQSDISYAQLVRNLHGDFEDNLILAAASRAHADLLVTNDVKLALYAPVPAMSVTDATRYLETLEMQEQVPFLL